MKTKFLPIASVTALFVTSFTACKKADLNDQKDLKNPLTTMSYTLNQYEQLGSLHNIGLDYLRDNESFNEGIDPNVLTSQSISLLNNITNNSLIYRGDDSTNLSIMMSDAYQNGSIKNINQIFEDIYSSSKVNSTEKNIIKTVKDAYDDALKTNDINRAISELRQVLNNQIAIYENSNWGNNDGEVAGGYLYILNKSLEYWQNEDISGGHGNDIMQPLVLAQVDAAGYLFGWTKAWLWDELPTPNERIKAGLGTAMQFSFVRGLGWVIK